MKNFIPVLLLLTAVSCNGPKNATSKKEETKNQAALTENLQQKNNEGIDLFAKGAAPASWTLEMDFDKIIRFKSLDGTNYNSTPVAPVENTTDNSSVFTTKAGKGDLVITLFKETCTDGLSGEKFNKRITVQVDGKRYEGCGQYLFDANLDGKWILEKINNNMVSAADFAKGLPELSFDLAAGSLSGHDGCNRIMGSMEVLGNRIKFSAIAGTKMACPGNKKENEIIHKLSNQVATYFFKDGQLVLYLIDDSMVVLKKA